MLLRALPVPPSHVRRPFDSVSAGGRRRNADDDLTFQLKRRYPNPDEKGSKKGEFNPFPDGTVRFYAASMALGLQDLHDAGFVYRDLKPANVLLDDKGNVRISDMGLTADISGGPIKHKAGSPGYWAPEQVKGEPYTTAPDWWSLGVTIYALATDKKLFHSEEETCSKMVKDHDWTKSPCITSDALKDCLQQLCLPSHVAGTARAAEAIAALTKVGLVCRKL